ncbi:hypothetical protein ACIRRA_31020 [Nocardia sp. NPDC101769]|uniref:hypothetical protein n=1 Tax=Nocardia sp. NPDC101769 TaxID=3364333 RepID=UPI00380B4D44
MGCGIYKASAIMPVGQVEIAGIEHRSFCQFQTELLSWLPLNSRVPPPEGPARQGGSVRVQAMAAQFAHVAIVFRIRDEFFPGDGSEDGLTFKIWTSEPGAARLPVMVWIQGGSCLENRTRNAQYGGAVRAGTGVVSPDGTRPIDPSTLRAGRSEQRR